MFWITTVLFFLSYNVTSESKSHLRVLHGRDAKDGEFPFVVSLFKIYLDDTSKGQEKTFFRFCTGSIISEDWVLTAAHCVINVQPHSVYILHTNFTTSPLTSNLFTEVQKIFIHPAYRQLDYEKIEFITESDVSLVLMDKLAMNSFGRLLAVDHWTMIGLPVIYVGSGGTKNTKPGDDNLRPLQVGEAAIGTCSSAVKSKYIICLAGRCGNRLLRPWYGDSGGPMLYDGRIIGVCSYGYDETVMMEEAYAAISPHIDWIYNVMQKKFNQITPSVPAVI